MKREDFVSSMKRATPLSEEKEKYILKLSRDACSPEIKGVVLMEELAELQQQVAKYIRGEGDRMGLLEEMADVYICMEFLRESNYISEGFTADEVRKAVAIKLEREYLRRMAE